MNVWVALSTIAHPHHDRAKSYWDGERFDRLAFCGATMMGLLRVLTTSAAMSGNPLTPTAAFRKYREFAGLPEIDFIQDSSGLDSRIEAWTSAPNFSGRLWSDAWIASIAMEHGCRIVSFDADFAKFPGLNFLHLKS